VVSGQATTGRCRMIPDYPPYSPSELDAGSGGQFGAVFRRR
jgi:hypothetical protein